MCITQLNVLQLFKSDIFASMHTPVRSTSPIHQAQESIKTHKEYGEQKKQEEEYTTICTQCKRVQLSSSMAKHNSGISIRVSDDEWLNSDEVANLRLARCPSHGLCRECFNNINEDLLTHSSSTPAINYTGNGISRRPMLSKSLSSPQLSRHLPSRPMRVLIVDDNRFQRQIHKRMVEQAGYDCDVAFNGAQALELVQKHSYCYILMDLVMFPMDGWTTSKKIRSTLLQSLGFASSTPKIVAVTGLKVDEKLAKQCSDAGMDDVMQKPVSSEMLNKVLQKPGKALKLDR